mmetsp:Transcript_17249/g.19819  ORF Transcript_17249/g.19819 Transcript_17249/m.19819 type:complete len:90 (-) Transcript_17249:112-381(-)
MKSIDVFSFNQNSFSTKGNNFNVGRQKLGTKALLNSCTTIMEVIDLHTAKRANMKSVNLSFCWNQISKLVSQHQTQRDQLLRMMEKNQA